MLRCLPAVLAARGSDVKAPLKVHRSTASAQRQHSESTKYAPRKCEGTQRKGREITRRKHSSAKSTAKAPRARREKARAYTTKGRRKRFQMTFTRAVRAPPRLRRSTGPCVVCFVFLCCALLARDVLCVAQVACCVCCVCVFIFLFADVGGVL